MIRWFFIKIPIEVVSKAAYGIFSIFEAWIDCIFPPYCKACKQYCRTRLLCSQCWELCTLLDPVHCCRHCFEEIEEGFLCQRCQKEPFLAFPSAYVFELNTASMCLCNEVKNDPEAIAAFLIVQWTRLQWPIPDAVIPMPGASHLAQHVAACLDCAYAPVLSFVDGIWECAADTLEEDQIFLLLGDKTSIEMLQGCSAVLGEAFPKKIYALSLVLLRLV